MDEISALKHAFLNSLRASAALASFVEERIFDVAPVAPHAPASPYVKFGQFSSQDDGAECFESYDITAQIDVYSWGAGEAASTAESLKISGIIKDIVNGMELEQDLPGDHVLTYVKFRSKRSITASDGVTKHVPITITAIVDKK